MQSLRRAGTDSRRVDGDLSTDPNMRIVWCNGVDAATSCHTDAAAPSSEAVFRALHSSLSVVAAVSTLDKPSHKNIPNFAERLQRGKIRRNEQFDAYYDVATKEWLERACGDPECDYCPGRPERAP